MRACNFRNSLDKSKIFPMRAGGAVCKAFRFVTYGKLMYPVKYENHTFIYVALYIILAAKVYTGKFF